MLQGVFSLVVATIAGLVTGSIWVALLAGSILLFIVAIKPAFLVLNKLVQRTNWYKSRVGDGLKFRKRIPCNLEVCNLGSTSGKYAFSYEGTGWKGENWAVGPQTLSYDFRVLKNYSSYLKEGAVVFIPLCPFSSCVKDFEDDTANYKYYSFLNPVLILNYSPVTKNEVMRFVNTPFQVSPFRSLLRLIRDVPAADSGVMDEESLKKDADLFMNNWKQQFSISDLSAPVSKENREIIIYNTSLLADMITFCLDRSLKPVIVIPPATKALRSKIPEMARETYIYSFVRNANTQRVPFLNYFDDERFADTNLFFNSFFLNKKGRELFTGTILKEIAGLDF